MKIIKKGIKEKKEKVLPDHNPAAQPVSRVGPTPPYRFVKNKKKEKTNVFVFLSMFDSTTPRPCRRPPFATTAEAR
jgi:hypothetical protein